MSAHLFNLLIVEDDSILASSIKMMAPACFKVYIAAQSELIPDHVFFHAAMVDMHLHSVLAGPEIIQKLNKNNAQTEIIAMSGDLNRKIMEDCLLSGATRFLAKPLVAEELVNLLEKVEAYWKLRQYQTSIASGFQLIGQSQSMENLRKQISNLKGERASILIQGETGTGKEVVAHLINQQETSRPFVSVNCSALTESLFESEFFGHIKGAFTGADQNKIGLAEAASGGDLFLDEIEALPLSQQPKLLRFLESGEIKKVGSKENQKVDVRVIAATNEALEKMVHEKKFREDLYYRLCSHKIDLTPLRNRKEDIEALVYFFLSLNKQKKNKSFTQDCILEMQQYSWPGNVRELKRICEQLFLASPLPLIRAEDVAPLIFKKPVRILESNEVNVSADLNLDEYLKQQEKKYLTLVLTQTNDLDQACEILKVSKSNLYKKIKDYSIVYE